MNWLDEREAEDGAYGTGGKQPVGRVLCPDGGACHHYCRTDEMCFRVETCGPLSGVYAGNRWPDQVVDAELEREADGPPPPTVERMIMRMADDDQH